MREVSGRTRVSCDLTRENYIRLHLAVAELGASKIAILNALVELLADPELEYRVAAAVRPPSIPARPETPRGS